MLISPTQDELLAKLVRLADGDTELVNRAMRAVSIKGTADLEKVTQYILERKRQLVRYETPDEFKQVLRAAHETVCHRYREATGSGASDLARKLGALRNVAKVYGFGDWGNQ